MLPNINWHKEALESYFEIVDYFTEQGMLQAADNFRKNVNEKIESIRKFPGGGRPTSKHKNLRYILVDKNRRMYYRYSKNTLTILVFFDARQNPEKTPY